jgi:hypothetical protein
LSATTSPEPLIDSDLSVTTSMVTTARVRVV